MVMPQVGSLLDLRPDRTASVSKSETQHTYLFDIWCGTPSIGHMLMERLQGGSFCFDKHAQTKLIVDAPQGFALQTLERLATEATSLCDASKSARNVREPLLRTAVVTFNSCAEYCEDLWDLRPNVLLVDPVHPDEFNQAIMHACAAGRYRGFSGDATVLNRSERQMLQGVARGWSNKAIADHLKLQEKTVMNTLSSVYSKLNLGGRTEAIVYYCGLTLHEDSGSLFGPSR